MAYNHLFPAIASNPGGGGPPPFDPEAGLTLTRTLAISSTHPGADFGRDDVSTVLAQDFVDLDGSAGGMTFEFGGAAKGVYNGFRGNGDYILRGGHGVDPVNSNTAYLLIPGGHLIITGTGTLVTELNETPVLTVRAWWNGVALGTPVAGSALYDMAGNNDGGIFTVGGSDVCAGEVTTPVSRTSASALRVYAGQTVS